MNTIERQDTTTEFASAGLGYQQNRRTGGVATFRVEGMEADSGDREEAYRQLQRQWPVEAASVRIGEWRVAAWGDGHNLHPQAVDALIRENKLLPGILRKQEDFLYGRGPWLYRPAAPDEADTADYKTFSTRRPADAPEVMAWLESWEEAGLPSWRDYVHSLIQDYYRVRTCVSRYCFAKGRRLTARPEGVLPVRALQHIGADRARLAAPAERNALSIRLRDEDCRYVLTGDWTMQAARDFDVWHRFQPADPFRYANAVAFQRERTFGRELYACCQWYDGLREWIKASNLTPKYLNSYLKNALNAHVHVQIPLAWVQKKEDELKMLCTENLAMMESGRQKYYTRTYQGVQLVDATTGIPYRYSQNMVQDLIACELEKITKLLSGEGKNQGKLYATTKMGDEGWTFTDFPGKFKEYFESVISYDKRADNVTLAGLGISSSITNVEQDGVISKSGSDVYYNYMVYLNTLAWPEEFVLRELNRAIRLNFPERWAEGVRVGLRIDIPLRQQETTPKDRM